MSTYCILWILDSTFDRIVFNRIDDEVFRKLVKARLAYPTSKVATVEYLKKPLWRRCGSLKNLSLSWQTLRPSARSRTGHQRAPYSKTVRWKYRCAIAKTITTIQIKLPLNKEVYTQTMLMARHQKIAKLFDEEFWVTRWRSQERVKK